MPDAVEDGVLPVHEVVAAGEPVEGDVVAASPQHRSQVTVGGQADATILEST
ncbi:hypothetical protein FHX42_003560 [Saccharopolyspora lacisalsi]|uniref:Uncharacterized protein n=1 Tax=Halosaccharopolyspora lacisalsi TaxID=1000566 RepID=A0A839DXF8_9PSEU|nr:hypothetical protein [Halosaccharopolyspora lacisalsi]MBA8826184.1 hypothetical protein [Halosaccharopolyspora lacisalsi]